MLGKGYVAWYSYSTAAGSDEHVGVWSWVFQREISAVAASLNESQVTNAVGALLDITMINEWREAGGRRRKTVGIKRQNAYRNTDAIDGYVQDNSFTTTFQCNLIYGQRGWYI